MRLWLLPFLALWTVATAGTADSPSPQSAPSSSPSGPPLAPAFRPAEGTGPTSQQPAGLHAARVRRAVDGDTIELADGRRVRYIGIDTPESVAPGRPVDCFGREASARNKALVEGGTIHLEKDVSETDRYGRLLRYVWVDGVLSNEALVREGFAQGATYPPDVKYQDRLLAAQRQAREEGAGLSSACAGGPPTGATPAQAPAAPATRTCDAAYPEVCIPPPPPDLDCGAIPHRRFRVLPPDPHRFDGDRDGIGCER